MAPGDRLIGNSFRMEAHYWEQVDEAAKAAGLSRSEFIRRAVIQVLGSGLEKFGPTTIADQASSISLSPEGEKKVLESAYGSYQAVLLLGKALVSPEWAKSAHESIRDGFARKFEDESWGSQNGPSKHLQDEDE